MMSYRTSTLAALLAVAANACSAPDSSSSTSAKSSSPEASAPPVQVGAAAAGTSRSVINPRLLRRFQPLEAPPAPETPMEGAKVALGRQLFFETRLSVDDDVSCNTCHALDRFGVDGKAISTGHGGAHGTATRPRS